MSALPDELPLEIVAPGSRWYRIHHRAREPLWWGRRRDGRFDDPAVSFGVCYFGTSVEACFAEALLRRPPVRILGIPDLELRAVSELATRRRLRLVQVHRPGLAKLGLTAAISSGPHAAAQSLSQALHAHAAGVDGLLYRPRHDDDTLAVALYERAGSPRILATAPLTGDLARLRQLLDRYGVALSGLPS